MQRTFYIEAFMHKAEVHEISPNEARMVLGVGYFQPENSAKSSLPAVEYRHTARDGLMHFMVDGETQTRTREDVLDLTWRLMRLGTVPTACLDAIRDIRRQHPLDVKAWEERLAHDVRPSSSIVHEDNVVQLPVRRKTQFVGPARPARTANL